MLSTHAEVKMGIPEKLDIGNSGSRRQEDAMRRAVLILVFFLGFADRLGAQTQQGSWSNLNRLKAGQEIRATFNELESVAAVRAD